MVSVDRMTTEAFIPEFKKKKNEGKKNTYVSDLPDYSEERSNDYVNNNTFYNAKHRLEGLFS